jgi:regulator of RNase E activity RraB
MSEDWDFYFLRVDDKPASISLDLGLSKIAPMREYPRLGWVRVYMKSPRHDGLSSQEEFDVLTALGDNLNQGLTGAGKSVYVGRNTSDGCRDFYFYVRRHINWKHEVEQLMQAYEQYEFDCDIRNDPEWTTYFEFLYPSEIDRQRIENRRVCTALQEHGDKLVAEREIEHWAYFPTPSARASYIDGARRLGFLLQSTMEPEAQTGSFGVRLVRRDVPSFELIDEATMPLFKLAKECGGDYDGWESVVVS